LKALQLNLGECGKNYENKYGQLIELVLMNLRTPFDVFILTFYTNRKAHKEYGNDYMFEDLYGLLIIDQHNLLDEGKLGGKHQSHLLKGKGKSNHKERGQFDTPIQRPGCLDQKPKGNTYAPRQI
jgi:hypothetical protein